MKKLLAILFITVSVNAFGQYGIVTANVGKNYYGVNNIILDSQILVSPKVHMTPLMPPKSCIVYTTFPPQFDCDSCKSLYELQRMLFVQDKPEGYKILITDSSIETNRVLETWISNEWKNMW